MKKKGTAKKIGCCLGAIVLSPLVILVLLGTLLFTPFDYIKFKRSSYRKNTGAKYVWLVTTSMTYKIYEIVNRDGLNIAFYPKPDATSALGYFLKDKTLLLQDTDNGVYYDKTRESWRIISEGLEKSLLVFFEEYKNSFKTAHGIEAENCVILMSENSEIDAEEKERAEKSGYFLFYSKKNLADTLSRFSQGEN